MSSTWVCCLIYVLLSYLCIPPIVLSSCSADSNFLLRCSESSKLLPHKSSPEVLIVHHFCSYYWHSNVPQHMVTAPGVLALKYCITMPGTKKFCPQELLWKLVAYNVLYRSLHTFSRCMRQHWSFLECITRHILHVMFFFIISGVLLLYFDVIYVRRCWYFPQAAYFRCLDMWYGEWTEIQKNNCLHLFD